MSHTPEHNAWTSAKTRCNNPHAKDYSNYGGRGIEMLLAFEEFFDEVGNRPSPLHSIDRKDTNGHYQRSNFEMEHPIRAGKKPPSEN